MAEYVGSTLASNIVQRIAELGQVRAQFYLGGRFEYQRRQVVELRHRSLQLAEHAGHTGVGVHQVGRSVAIEAEHQVKVEAVVAAAMLGQVGILDRADANRARDVAQLAGA